MAAIRPAGTPHATCQEARRAWTLTGGLAHEIKNPLSTVQLNLQLLKEDLSPDHPGYSRLISRLVTITKETSRLREILDDFCDSPAGSNSIENPRN